MDEKERERFAMQLIKDWKTDTTLRLKYKNDLALYAIHQEWKKYPGVRSEFQDDFEAFYHWKMNEHRTTIIGS